MADESRLRLAWRLLENRYPVPHWGWRVGFAAVLTPCACAVAIWSKPHLEPTSPMMMMPFLFAVVFSQAAGGHSSGFTAVLIAAILAATRHDHLIQWCHIVGYAFIVILFPPNPFLALAFGRVIQGLSRQARRVRRAAQWRSAEPAHQAYRGGV